MSHGLQSVQASVVVGRRPSYFMACRIPVPESPELQGELSTTGPPGKSLEDLILAFVSQASLGKNLLVLIFFFFFCITSFKPK